MTRTLAQWLAYQEGVNPRSIELGLDRVRAVWQRMGAPRIARHVITVGGTNGKGSTVAMLEAMLHAAGRHDLQLMVERQRVIDVFLQDPTSPDVHHNAARELLGELLTPEEAAAVHAEFVLRACGQAGPWAEIVRYAKEREFDLIIVGTHGRGAPGHLLMGSVAEKVVRMAPCPVLTVRHPQHDFVIP